MNRLFNEVMMLSLLCELQGTTNDKTKEFCIRKTMDFMDKEIVRKQIEVLDRVEKELNILTYENEYHEDAVNLKPILREIEAIKKEIGE